MKLFQKLNEWQQTTPGLITYIVLGTGLAYLFGSLAVHTGSLLDYVLTFLLVVMVIQCVVALLAKNEKDKRRG